MRLLRFTFAVVGALAAILAVGTAVAAVVFYTPGSLGRAVFGTGLYVAIAATCFYAVLRIGRATHRSAPRCFDVIVPERRESPRE